MGESRWAGLQRRERQHEDALRGRRAHRDAGPAETAVEQQLDEQPAVRVADQHGRAVELADQALVVVDDLGDAEAGRVVRGLAHLLDVALLARPLRGGDVVALLPEEVAVGLPAPGREPGTMDQHQLRPVGFHAVSLRSDCPGRPYTRVQWVRTYGRRKPSPAKYPYAGVSSSGAGSSMCAPKLVEPRCLPSRTTRSWASNGSSPRSRSRSS